MRLLALPWPRPSIVRSWTVDPEPALSTNTTGLFGPLVMKAVVSAAGDAIAELLRPEPLSTMFLLIVTCSVYVPVASCTVSPGMITCEMAKLIVLQGVAGVAPHATA